MKILHVIASMNPASGGPPVVVAALASAQARLGNGVHVLTYGDQPAPVATDKPYTEHTLPPARLLEKLAARHAAQWLRQHIRDYDVLHLHGVWEPLLKAAATAASRAQVPYVVAPHGMLDPWSLSRRKWKKDLALLMGRRQMLTEASFLHVLNADEKRLIEPLGYRAAIEIIPNGVFPAEFETLPAVGTFRNNHPELGSDEFVLFLSRLHFKKGLDFLAEAFALLLSRNPALRLVVAGPDGGARGEFQQHVARLGISERVHIIGPIYGPEKIAAFVDAACFCLPSRQEGFSMAITEALACGLPVVISQACHFPEVAEAGAGEIVPLDASAIVAGLQKVLANPAQRSAMGRAGRELVFSSFTWPKIAVRSVEAYARHSASR